MLTIPYPTFKLFSVITWSILSHSFQLNILTPKMISVQDYCPILISPILSIPLFIQS